MYFQFKTRYQKRCNNSKVKQDTKMKNNNVKLEKKTKPVYTFLLFAYSLRSILSILELIMVPR